MTKVVFTLEDQYASAPVPHSLHTQANNYTFTKKC